MPAPMAKAPPASQAGGAARLLRYSLTRPARSIACMAAMRGDEVGKDYEAGSYDAGQHGPGSGPGHELQQVPMAARLS
jgi:hypothetical protein